MKSYKVKDNKFIDSISLVHKRQLISNILDTLYNSYAKKVDFKIDGRTSQESTTGKQLLNNVGPITVSINGISFVKNSDGSVTANGTTADNETLYTIYNGSLENSGLEKDIPYIVSDKVAQQNLVLQIYQKINNSWNFIGLNGYVKEKEFSFDENATDIWIRLRVPTNTTVNNITSYPMIRLASVKDDTYEPYTNGASPNPTFAQSINCITGNKQISILTKNLITVDDYRTNSSGTTIKYLDTIPKIEINKNYRISAYLEDGTKITSEAAFVIVDSNDNQLLNWNINNYVKTNTNDLSSANRCYIYTSANLSNKLITKVQLSEGEEELEYQKSYCKDFTIPFGNLEFHSIDDYKDQLYFKDGYWYKHKEIGKVILDGSENWNTQMEGYQTTLNISNNTKELLCNSFTNVRNYAEFITKDYAIGKIYSTIQNLYIRNVDTPTVQDFKNWLSTNNVSVVYPLIASSEELITDTKLVNKLNELLNYLIELEILDIEYTISID